MEIKYTTLEDALNAVSKKGLEIQYCSPELIANLDVLKAAINDNYISLEKIGNVKMPNSDQLIVDNKELIMKLIKIEPRIYRKLKALKKDYDITKEAVSKYGDLIKDADSKFQNNKELFMIAVTNSIYAISNRVSEDFKNDKEIALLVLGHENNMYNRYNISWLGNNLKQELINKIGYDVTLEPANRVVIGHVITYLKSCLENKPFTKPECPYKKEEIKQEQKVEIKKEEKNEIKEEVKPTVKEEIKQQIEIEPIKEEIKPVVNTTLEPKKIVEENNIQTKIENEVKKELGNLTELYSKLHENYEKLNQIKTEKDIFEKVIKEQIKTFETDINTRILNIEKEMNDIRDEINKQVNAAKGKVLELK